MCATTLMSSSKSRQSESFVKEMHPCAIFYFTDIEEKKMEEAVKLLGDTFKSVFRKEE